MPQTPEHPIEKPGPEETLEFLKRNEVHTMAKEVAQLREEETKKEREKIVSMKPEAPAPQKEPSPPLMPPVSTKAGAPQALGLPKRPARFDKVFIRAALILGVTFVLVNVVAFAVWNAKKNSRAGTAPAPSAPISELIESDRPTPVQIPGPLFPVENTKIRELAQEDSVLASLSELVEKESIQGVTRILFKDVAQNRLLTLSEVLEGVGFKLAPEIAKNDILFLSVSGEHKRIGFASSLQDTQNARELLKAQEKTFEQDAAPFLSLVSQKGQGYVSFFRTVAYKGTNIRCQTFSIQDFGICYAIVGDKLVFTTSLEGMKHVIGLLAPNQ